MSPLRGKLRGGKEEGGGVGVRRERDGSPGDSPMGGPRGRPEGHIAVNWLICVYTYE